MISKKVGNETILLLSVKELADILSVSERTTRTYLTSGLIPFCRIGKRYYVTLENAKRYLRGASSTRRKKSVPRPEFDFEGPPDPWESD